MPLPLKKNIPDFLIVGAQKAGTTSLFHYLNQHPDIFMPSIKEVHYFDLHFQTNFDTYQSYFYQAATEGKVTGEASPYYLFHPCVPTRVKVHLPDVKLIILLRNPVERAFSHFRHSYRKGLETVADFFDAIALEEERLCGAEEALIQNKIQWHFSFQHHSYLSRGYYSRQIDRWLENFQLSQMYFIQSESFFAQPGSVMSRVFEFLEVSDVKMSHFNIHNPGTALYPMTHVSIN